MTESSPLNHHASAALASSPDKAQERTALLLNISAFLLWASATLLFKQLQHLPVWELFAQRILWSLAWCLLFLAGTGALGELRLLFRARRSLGILLLSTLLIASNWFLVIWAVGAGQLLDASLGYYLAPIFSVLLGKLLFQEASRRGEWWCLGLCLLGVLLIACASGQPNFPWVGLSIALSFALYSALKKRVRIAPLAGLTVETALAALPAALILLGGSLRQAAALPYSATDGLLLVAIGLLTTLPMLFYIQSVKHLSMTAIGYLQYLNPSLMFLLAVFAFAEPLNRLKLLGFGLIWLSLLHLLLRGSHGQGRTSQP